MSVELDERIRNLKGEEDIPDDVDELNEVRDWLYEKMDLLTGEISSDTEDLAEFYKDNIRKKGVSCIKKDDKIYETAKRVNDLVNEFNDIRILIELIEKKIEKHDK